MDYNGYIVDNDPELFQGCRGVEIPRPDYECDGCRNLIINGTSKSLNEWVEDAEHAIGPDSGKQNLSAFNVLYSVLTQTNPGWTSDEAQFVKKSYQLIGLAYGNALFTRETRVPRPVDFTNNDSSAIYYLRNQEIDNQKLDDPIYAPDSLSRQFDQMLSSAASYTIAQQTDSASAALAGLDDLSTAAMENVRNRWQCVAAALQQYRDSVLRRDEVADAALNCAAAFRMDVADDEFIGMTNEKLFVAYPNPTSGQLTLHCEGLTDKQLTIEVYDNLGRLCQRHFFETPTSTFFKSLSLKSLTPGLYQVKMTNGSNVNVTGVILTR